MADNDQNNDEYKFVELDGLDNDMMGDMEGTEPSHGAEAVAHPHTQTDIKRNALIAVGVIVALMVMYKMIGYLFFSKDTDTAQKNTASDIALIAPPKPIVPPVVSQQPVVAPVTQQQIQPAQPVASENYTDLTRKISVIELSQQNVRSDVSSVSEQVGAVNSNISNLNNEIASLNQVIKGLSDQLAKQSEEINTLMLRTQPKREVKHIIKSTTSPVHYYIQAVIPGRAWLIATNGSTLTVREGTRVSGYGIVKLIDPLEGRIVTSSGQVIRFSQEDS